MGRLVRQKGVVLRLKTLAALPAILMTVGCLQSERLIKINGDGSGTIVDTVKLGDQAKGMLAGMAQMDKTPAADKKAKKDAKLRAAAAKMGPGVTLVSAEATPDGGERVTWAFTDISKIKIDQSASSSDMDSTSKPSEQLTFRFAKSPAGVVLTVVTPKRSPSSPNAAKPAPKPEEAAAQITQMKAMLAGLKLSTGVEVNGTLIKTDSPYVAGSVVTLMAVDFDQLDENSFKKMSSVSDPSELDAKALAGIKGVKMTTGDVNIEFKPK
jgi:hypothetical protein